MKSLLYLFFLIPTLFFSQVGINTNNPNPNSMLDVNGNLDIHGDFRPNDDPGVNTQLLTSGGDNLPPVWAATLDNTITHMGRAVTNLIDINANTITVVTINDPGINIVSSTDYVWWNRTTLSGNQSDFALVTCSGIELNAAGQWQLSINNPSPSSFRLRIILGRML